MEPSPTGSIRGCPARSPEDYKQVVAAGGRGGLGVPLHHVPALWSKSPGSEDASEGSPGLLSLPACPRGCHFQGNEPCQESSPTRRRSSSGSCQERKRCGQSCLPAAANGTVHTRAGSESRATATPQPFHGIRSPPRRFLLLTFAKPFAVLRGHKHVTHKGSGTWRVPQQLLHTGTNPALLRSLWEGGRS